MKITYFNKREREKRVRRVILGQKLTLNHHSLMDKGETKILVTAHNSESEKRGRLFFISLLFGLYLFLLFLG